MSIKRPHSVSHGIGRSMALRTWGFGTRTLRDFTDWIEDKRFIRRHRRYITNIRSRGDFEALLEALCLTTEQFDVLSISPLASAELLSRMMERTGLLERQVDLVQLKAAQERCRLCGRWRQCRRWLDRGVGEADCGEFCESAASLVRRSEIERRAP